LLDCETGKKKHGRTIAHNANDASDALPLSHSLHWQEAGFEHCDPPINVIDEASCMASQHANNTHFYLCHGETINETIVGHLQQIF
jgi:hypothetical protein